ncbi:MAG: branched-chain amino acid aminotransferase, partial [Dehalococcoidia bacterium]|nr:branched-chain amino acid aminotransferase [Dehalococcoidia bacterium]
ADEAFLTGTPFCILPTTQFNGINIGDGKMGQITTKLLNRWSENVGLDIMAQIKNYADEEQNNKKSNAPTPYQFVKK